MLATVADHGPFAQTGMAADEQILNMQLFLSLAVLSTLLVSARHRRAHHARWPSWPRPRAAPG